MRHGEYEPLCEKLFGWFLSSRIIANATTNLRRCCLVDQRCQRYIRTAKSNCRNFKRAPIFASPRERAFANAKQPRTEIDGLRCNVLSFFLFFTPSIYSSFRPRINSRIPCVHAPESYYFAKQKLNRHQRCANERSPDR